MLRIGITGGIGSGKSTAAGIFRTLDVPVYEADQRARVLMEQSPSVMDGIRRLFGWDIFSEEGKLNRASIAGQVFKDKEKLDALNNIVHPAVKKDFNKWIDSVENTPYCLYEAAILVETGGYSELDRLITVIAPEELRIQRVVDRDGVKESQVRSRMANQFSDREKVRVSDYLIINDGEHLLIPQVLEIHRHLLWEF